MIGTLAQFSSANRIHSTHTHTQQKKKRRICKKAKNDTLKFRLNRIEQKSDKNEKLCDMKINKMNLKSE